MKQIGIKKEIDRLGRLQIPKEIRELLGLEQGVEPVLTSNGLLIRNPQYVLKKKRQKDRSV